MVIEQCDNGYIAYRSAGANKTIHNTLDDLLSHVLLVFEGRAESFSGEKHGQVIIIRRPRIDPPIKGCGTCGSALVHIRGRRPGEDNREVCPTCAVERLEQIGEIVTGNLIGQTQATKLPNEC